VLALAVETGLLVRLFAPGTVTTADLPAAMQAAEPKASYSTTASEGCLVAPCGPLWKSLAELPQVSQWGFAARSGGP